MTGAQRNYYIIPAQAMVVALIAVIFLCSGCSRKADEDKEAKGSAAPKKGISKKIETLTGNHSKLVWSRYLGKSDDVYVNGKTHQLWGIDTRDGLGVRAIVEKKSNYARPIISPDGKWIVYTNKHTERDGIKKSFKPIVHRVDWKGENGQELGKGFAVDMWEDPKTKKVWVYVANLTPTDRSSMYANKLERFQLDDPKKRELVWEKTKISVDNIQLSNDGQRASCLFPWPDVGVIDLAKNEYWRNQHGCWPSLAPDNSYVAWVFDGSHKSVHLFADRGKKLSVVNINNGPGMGGKEMYHPRWSNHPRLMTVTGPYKGPTIGKSGKYAEVYIGKFSKALKSIDSWVRVTDDSKGDHYPDLWVKGGDKVSLGKIGGAGQSTTDPKTELAKSWPTNTKGLIFLWENSKAQNQIMVGKSQRACGVEVRQRARFGRHFEMLAGGGYFEADSVSAKAIGVQIGKGEFAFQLRLTSNDHKQSGTILSYEGFQLRQEEPGELTLSAKGISYSMGNIKAGDPIHLAGSFQDEKWILYRNGNALETESIDKGDSGKTTAKGLGIGDGHWDGKVEGLAIYGRELKAEEVASDFANLKAKTLSRKPAHRVKLRGKLVEMTEVRGVEELDTYRRALLVYTYEVEKVIEGKYDQSKVFVNHWSIMDKEPLKSIPRKLGQTYLLEIEHLKEHPELTGERRWNDSFSKDQYYDITTPAP